MKQELILDKLKQYNYPEKIQPQIIRKLNALESNLSYDFEGWVINDTIPVVEYEGYSFDILTQEYGLNPINAFITLDWLRRQPEQAKAALENGIK